MAAAAARIKLRRLTQATGLPPRFDHTLVAFGTRTTGGSESALSAFLVGGHTGQPSDGASLDVFQLTAPESGSSAWAEAEITNATQVPPRGSHASAVYQDAVFLFGGFADGKNLDDVAKLSLGSREWLKPVVEGTGPSARSGHTATAARGRIIVLGGSDGEGSAFNDVYIFHSQSAKWVKPVVLGAAPPGRCNHTATLVVPKGDKILVFGGSGSNQQPLSDIWSLEIETPFVNAISSKLGREVVAWSRIVVDGSPDSAAILSPTIKPIVICGPSGVGTGTLICKLMAEYPYNFGFSVSHTTRKPRPGEENGVHYNFTDYDSMKQEISDGKFLEWAEVHGNFYGTSWDAVSKVANDGKICVLDIDVQGASQVRKAGLPATFVFVSPPSIEELETRLRGRGTEAEEAIQKRMGNATKEIERSKEPGLFDFFLVNDDLGSAYEQLKALIQIPFIFSSSAASTTSALESLSLENRESEPIAPKEEGVGPSARSGHVAVMVQGNLIVHGGVGAEGKPLTDAYILDIKGLTGGAPGPTAGAKWVLPPVEMASASTTTSSNEENASVTQGRYNHRAVAISENEVLVVGGYDGEKPLSDSFVISVQGS